MAAPRGQPRKLLAPAAHDLELDASSAEPCNDRANVCEFVGVRHGQRESRSCRSEAIRGRWRREGLPVRGARFSRCSSCFSDQAPLARPRRWTHFGIGCPISLSTIIMTKSEFQRTPMPPGGTERTRYGFAARSSTRRRTRTWFEEPRRR